jgi:hypothetical protein
VEYDPGVIVPLAVAPAGLLTAAPCGASIQWLDPGLLDGSLEIDVGILGCSVDGPGALLTVTFAGVTDGTSPLDCTQVILRDSTNATIPVTCTPITISYSCPVPTENRSWGWWKSIH